MKAHKIGLPTFEASVSCGAYCQGGSVNMQPTTYPEFTDADEVWVKGEDAAKLAAENAALRSTIDDLTAGEIHTCHDHCQRTACILRRENTALRSRLAERDRQVDKWARFSESHGWLDAQEFTEWIAYLQRRLAEAELSRDSWKREARLNQQAADESAGYARQLAEAEEERALILQRAENAEAALVESDALLREMLAWKVAIECIAPELGGAIMTLARIYAHLAREGKL